MVATAVLLVVRLLVAAEAPSILQTVRGHEGAAAVVYFNSDEAAFVTGQTLSVSGGLTMS